MDSRAIGVFDSGLGGLTAVKELRKRLPHEDIVYLGDTARVPYGTRSKELVTKFSLQDAYFLAGQGVKCIVIACNTASSLSYDEIKKKISIPLFEVITTGARDAVKKTRNNKIGIIGTNGTIASCSYQRKIKELSKVVEVYSKACPLLVPFIEAGEIHGKLVELVINKYLEDLKSKNIDILILGCTHYPILEEEIGRYFGGNIILINPAIELSKKLSEFLKKKSLLTGNIHRGSTRFFLTDVVPETKMIAELFLGEKFTTPINKVYLE